MKSSQQDLKMQCKPAVSEVNMTQLQGGKTLRRSDSETFIGPECFFWISFFLATKIRRNDHQPDTCKNNISSLFFRILFLLWVLCKQSPSKSVCNQMEPSCTEEMESALTNDIMVSSVLAGRSFWTIESTTAYDSRK